MDRIMRWGAILLIGVVLAITVSGCGEPVQVPNHDPYPPYIQANLQHKGLIAEEGGWVYFSNVQDGYKLYRSRFDGTDLEKMEDEAVFEVIVSNGYLYYLVAPYAEVNETVRVNLDTGAREVINEQTAYRIRVCGDFVYYLSDDQVLHRMKLDGAAKTKVSNVSIGGYWLTKDYLIFRESESRNLLIKRGDQSPRRIVSSETRQLLVADGWVYYVHTEDWELHRVKLDGSGDQMISGLGVSYLNYCDGWLVFANIDDGNRLYKMRPDGTEATVLSETRADEVNVLGTSVFYQYRDSLYMVNITGKGLRKFPNP